MLLLWETGGYEVLLNSLTALIDPVFFGLLIPHYSPCP